MAAIQERNQEATVYVGDLDAQVNEALLWELMLQAGPVINVHIPKDKLTQQHMGYGFVEFHGEEDADYAMKIMNMIKLFGKPIRVNKASRDKKTLDVGANLFIGNLDPDVDEKLLYDTFSAFGVIISTPKIMRDPDTGASKGFGFVSFDSFESSDAAIEAMSGQYLCNRPIHVSYALKKDSKGERHGSQAERLLAASNPNRTRPHTIFASGMAPPVAAFQPPPAASGAPPAMMMMAPPQATPQPQYGLPPHMMGAHPQGMMMPPPQGMMPRPPYPPPPHMGGPPQPYHGMPPQMGQFGPPPGMAPPPAYPGMPPPGGRPPMPPPGHMQPPPPPGH
jgi:splicing factor 3B subunit 4